MGKSSCRFPTNAVCGTVFLLIFLLLSSAAVAASDSGILRGTVTALGANDQTYRVAGATLRLRGNGLSPLTAVSNDDGEYKFADLNPGLYTLEIAAKGFATQTRKIVIRAGETTLEDIR